MEWRLLIITITLVVTYVYVNYYHYWFNNINLGIINSCNVNPYTTWYESA